MPHVVSASRRTDIPAFYTPWLLGRLEAGFCEVANPFFRSQVRTVSLRPEDVLGIVFWTKNPRPLLPHLPDLLGRGYRCAVQFTINPYDHVFERAVLPADRAVEAALALSELLGAQRVVWRYDPIVECDLTPWAWHLEQFEALASQLGGRVREVIISFANLYQRTRRRMDRLAVEHGFNYRFYGTQPEQTALSAHGRAYEPEEMRQQAAELGGIARRYGLRLASCCGEAIVDPAANVLRAHCIEPDLLGLSRLPAKPTREQCGCCQSIDIGAYETCPHGCGASYCYAVASHEKAVANCRAHDPSAPRLG